MNLLTTVLCILAATSTPAETWPGFRGDGSGISTARNLPVRWSPGDVAWRTEVPGYGQSSPVIRGDRVFVTSVDGPNLERCFVHGFDLGAGSRLWTVELPASQPLENYFRNSRAAPTCVVDEERVCAFFAGGDVVCLTLGGKILWTRSLVRDYGEFHNDRGLASSLAQTDDAVFVLVDHEGPSYLLAVSKRTGETLWKADRGTRGAAWTSPLVVERNGRTLVIVSSAGTVEAHDAGTGELLWKREGLSGNRIPSAGISGDSLFVGATQSAHRPGDLGAIRRSNCRLRLTETDRAPACESVWSAKRATSYYSTPLAYRGFVYYVNRTGLLYCLDQETGEQQYVKRIRDAAWASAIGGGGHVYLFQKGGRVRVIRPGPRYEEVASNRLWAEGEEIAASSTSSGSAPSAPGSSTGARQEAAAARTGASSPSGRAGFDAAIRSMDLATQHRIFSYHDPVIYGAAAVEGHLVIRSGLHLYCVRGSSSPSGRIASSPDVSR